MSVALDKCFKTEFRGNQHEFILCETAVESPKVIKDPGVHVSKHLTWTTYIDSRMSKANKTFFCIKLQSQNSRKIWCVQIRRKSCSNVWSNYLQYLKKRPRETVKFPKKVLKWIMGNDSDYTEQLRLLNILPLALFLQLNVLLMMEKFMHEENDHIKLPAIIENPGRTKEIFNLITTRTEKAREEYTFRTCRLIYRLNQKVEFREMRGLKRRLIQMMWKFFDDQFSEQNKCTWVLCDCNICRNNWTKF